MDIELSLKILALVVSAFGAWKILSELARARRSTLREEYRFAKEFFADLQSKESLHPYVRDKGFEALARDRSLTTREIEYLVSLPGPAQSLREYANGRRYLEHAATAGDKQIMLKKRYQKSWILRAILLGYLLLFLAAYSAAWSPLLFPSVPHRFGVRVFAALPFTALAFGPIAYYFFSQGMRVGNALSLIRRVKLLGSGHK
jgi:hypothetical protein